MISLDKWNKNLIMNSVQKQVEEKLAQKYNYKRTPSTKIEQLLRKFLRLLFGLQRHTAPNFPISVTTYDFGFDEYNRDIMAAIRTYIETLFNRGVNLHAFLVMGSRAKNRAKRSSDIDVLIIASNLPGASYAEFTNFPQKILEFKRQQLFNDISINIGIQVSSSCSKSEFLQWMHNFKVVALDAIYFGKPIYDDGFWEKTIAEFKEITIKYKLNENRLKTLLIPL
jgi:hypothetical protein